MPEQIPEQIPEPELKEPEAPMQPHAPTNPTDKTDPDALFAGCGGFF